MTPLVLPDDADEDVVQPYAGDTVDVFTSVPVEDVEQYMEQQGEGTGKRDKILRKEVVAEHGETYDFREPIDGVPRQFVRDQVAFLTSEYNDWRRQISQAYSKEQRELPPLN